MKTRMEVEIEEDGEPDPLVEALSSGAALLLRHRDGRRAKVDLSRLVERWATS